jgi:hypothetical protein
LLVYLIRHEDDSRDELRAADFEDAVFLQSVIAHRPDAYFDVYGGSPDGKPSDNDIEWITPQTPEDLTDVLQALKAVSPGPPRDNIPSPQLTATPQRTWDDVTED